MKTVKPTHIGTQGNSSSRRCMCQGHTTLQAVCARIDSDAH
jgi:hypothetical protein